MSYIQAKTKNQRKYIRTIIENDITLCTGPAGCVDGETEFLSQFGWKKISEYRRLDQVLQFDPNMGFAYFVWPKSYINEPCSKFYHISGNHVDQMLTEEHNVCWKTKGGSLAKKRFSEINNWEQKIVPTTFNYSGHNFKEDQELLEEYIKIFLEFDNGILADGNEFTMTANKIEHAKEICELLEKLNIKYTVVDEKNKIRITADVDNSTFARWQFCSSIFAEKFLNITSKLFNNRAEFKKKENAEFYQWCRTITHNVCSIRYKKDKDIYVCYDGEQNVHFSEPKLIEHKIERSKYCFEVDSGFLVLRRNGRIFITGNSGKDYVALGIALEHIQRADCPQNKLYITRPMVSTGRRDFPYIKGDLREKCDPYFAPILNNLREIIGEEKAVTRMIENKQIILQPLELMRGYTFSDSYVVMSEMQNSTVEQAVMAITRIGENTKMILNGDIDQKDIEEEDGLYFLWRKLVETDSGLVGSMKLNIQDIQRNPVIGKILTQLNWNKSI